MSASDILYRLAGFAVIVAALVIWWIGLTWTRTEGEKCRKLQDKAARMRAKMGQDPLMETCPGCKKFYACRSTREDR
jgi:hypothetical protein